jgi:flagellar hook-length control protein FliK
MSTILSAASPPTALPPVRPGTAVHASAGGGGLVLSPDFASFFRSTSPRSEPQGPGLDPGLLHGRAETVGDSPRPETADDTADPAAGEDGQSVSALPTDPSPQHGGSPVAEGEFASPRSQDQRFGGAEGSRAELHNDKSLTMQGHSSAGMSGFGETLRLASPDLPGVAEPSGHSGLQTLHTDLRLSQAVPEAAGLTEVDGPVGGETVFVALPVHAGQDQSAAALASVRDRLQPPPPAVGDWKTIRSDPPYLLPVSARHVAEMAVGTLPASRSPAGPRLLQLAAVIPEVAPIAVGADAQSGRTGAAGMHTPVIAAPGASPWGDSIQANTVPAVSTASAATETLLVQQTTSAGLQIPTIKNAVSQPPHVQSAAAFPRGATAGSYLGSSGEVSIPTDAAGTQSAFSAPAQTGSKALSGPAGAPMPGPDGLDRLAQTEHPPALSLVAGQMTTQAPTPAAGPATTSLATLTAMQIASALSAPQSAQGTDLVLSPPELGRVTIRFEAERAGGALILLIDRPETLDLMRRNLDTLDQALRQAGHEGCSVALGGRGGDRHPPAPVPDPAVTTSGGDTPSRREVAFERSASVSGHLDLRL